MAHCVAEEVERELDDIWLYIARQSSIEIADKVVDSIIACFIALGRNPYMGRSRDEDLLPGLRSFPAGNYIIIYYVDGEDAAILHVLHGNRDIQAFFH